MGSGTRREMFPDGVEKAVDERRRLLAAVALGDLDGLVDHDGRNEGRLIEELTDGDPQDVAVDDRHPRQAPVFRSRLDGPVDLLAPFLDPVDQPASVLPDIGRRLLVFPVLPDERPRIARVELHHEEHLEGALPRFPAFAHG